MNDDETKNLSLGEGQEIKFFTPEEVAKLDVTPRVRELFEEYGHVIQKFVEGGDVSAHDLGLKE